MAFAIDIMVRAFIAALCSTSVLKILKQNLSSDRIKTPYYKVELKEFK